MALQRMILIPPKLGKTVLNHHKQSKRYEKIIATINRHQFVCINTNS
jgi:hypothetical protein